MFGKFMTWALNNSKHGQTCSWKSKVCRYVKTGDRSYQLAEEWWCRTGIECSAARLNLGGRLMGTIDETGLLRILPGFAWDGPSGPTYQTEDSIAGSLAHDFLYRCARERKFGHDMRAKADELALRIWLQDGMYKWRARLWFKALRKFAQGAYEGPPEKIVEAK